MAIVIKFNDVDKTSSISRDNFKIKNVLTKEVDTCFLTIKNYEGHTYKPDLADDIKIFDNGEKIFAGIVVKIAERMEGAKIIAHDIECIDYTRLADKKLVAEYYEQKTVDYIIENIVSNYLSGFTVNNVDCDKVVDYVAFNYEPFSKCLQRLAELVGYDWYIDYDKDIHFFSKETNPAPFNLTDNNGRYIFKSLEIVRDTRQLKNVIYVRGGEYTADWFTENQFGDGVKRDFKTAYKYKSIEVKVATFAKTVGIDYIHDPADYDCLYNFNEKVVKFRDDNKPADTVAVDISGYPYVPVIIEARNQDSIDEYGEFWFRIIDKSIKTKKGARERGKGELETYAAELSEGSFVTREKGLRSGQIINVQSSLRNLNESFLINRVLATMRTHDEMEYIVSLVTTKTMGIIDFLQKLLMADDRKIAISEDEVVDKIWTAFDNFTIQEKAYLWNIPVSPPWYVKDGNIPVGVVGFCQAS